MKSLKVLGIIELVLIAFMFLAVFGGATEEAVGFWALSALGLAIAQSIVGISKPNNK